MEITIYRRHSADCKHKDDRYHPRCGCSLWFQFNWTQPETTLDGNKLRRGQNKWSAETRIWSEAQTNLKRLRADLEALLEGKPVRQSVTVKAAVNKWLEFRRKNGLTSTKGGAESLAAEASKELPLDFPTNKVTLDAVRANVLLNRKNPAGALGERHSVIPYDFADASKGETIYYRGEALLQMHSGKEAAAEFQKLVRGPADMVHWSLAHLGLARAYTMMGDKDKSLAAYREFLELWKNAGPDVPVLKQAKAEYAKLQ